MLGFLIQGLLLGFPTSAQPGPFQAFLLQQTMRYGWKRTLPAALAPLLSDGPIIIIVILILQNLPTTFLLMIRFAGACFLFYLAIGAIRGYLSDPDTRGIVDTTTSSGLRKAIIVNMLGPGPWVFWSTVGGPILLKGVQTSIWHAVSFLSGFYLTMIVMFSVYIYLFGILQRTGRKTAKVMSLVSGLALVTFAIYMLIGVWQQIAAQG